MQPGTIDDVREQLKPLMGGTGGIDSLLSGASSATVLHRLAMLPTEPLSCSQFNQLLALSHTPDFSEGAFKYYWLSAAPHSFDVTQLPHYHPSYITVDRILSLDQLAWGLYRFYFDSLLYFGTLSSGYRELRSKAYEELEALFALKRFPGDRMAHRGPALELDAISRDDRYLIAEQACKSFEPSEGETDMLMVLKGAWQDHIERGGGRIKTKELLQSAYVLKGFAQNQGQFIFAADELLESEIGSEAELLERYNEVRTVGLTAEFHPEIVPASVQKMNDAGLVVLPDVTLKTVVEFEITPVTAPPVGTVGAGTLTTRLKVGSIGEIRNQIMHQISVGRARRGRNCRRKSRGKSTTYKNREFLQSDGPLQARVPLRKNAGATLR